MDHINLLLTTISEDLKEVKKDISEIKILDAQQNEQLQTHMKRSDMLEKRVEQIDKEIRSILPNILKWIAALAGLALTIKELLWP